MRRALNGRLLHFAFLSSVTCERKKLEREEKEERKEEARTQLERIEAVCPPHPLRRLRL
jgi:hypothetical protein